MVRRYLPQPSAISWRCQPGSGTRPKTGSPSSISTPGTSAGEVLLTRRTPRSDSSMRTANPGSRSSTTMPGCAGGRHSLARPPVNGAVDTTTASSTSGSGRSNGARFSAK